MTPVSTMATGPTTTLFENYGFDYDHNNSDSGSGVWDEHEHANSEPCDRALSDEFKKIFLPTVYGIIFILGTVGNSLVVWVMGYQKKLKTKTDKYRLHLSVADLLFVLTLPFWAVDATSSWYFGGFLCVAVHVIYTVNLYSSVLILAFISLDRYLAVVHATSSQATRQLLANKVIYLGVWLPAVLLTVPDLVFTKVHTGDSRIFCTHTFATDTRFIWTAVFQLQHILVGFLLPGLVILVCYCIIICKLNEGSKGHQKRKALKTTIILILCFFSCWLPYCMGILMDTLMLLNVVSYSCAFEQGRDMWIFLTESLAYFHCCLNPILYAFLGVKFKKSARSALSTSWGSSHKMLSKKRGAISSVSTESESSSFHSS